MSDNVVVTAIRAAADTIIIAIRAIAEQCQCLLSAAAHIAVTTTLSLTYHSPVKGACKKKLPCSTLSSSLSSSSLADVRHWLHNTISELFHNCISNICNYYVFLVFEEFSVLIAFSV